MVSSDRDEFNTNHPVYMRLYYLQHLYKVAEKLQNSKDVFPSELHICNFIEPVNYDEKMESDFEVELTKVNTSKLDQNLLYMLHELDVFMGLYLKLLKPTKLITKFYKKYVIDLLEIDKRVQKKTVTDRITLDDLLGVIGKAYISYTKSPNFYKDMKKILDHLLKESLFPTLCESPSKNIPLGKYIFDEIYPAAKKLYGDYTYNEMVNSSYSKLRKRIVFKNNDLLYCLLIEGLKIAFVHKFKYVIMTLLSNTDKYKAFKPFVVSNHAIVTNKIRVLYNNTTTIKKYISEHDKVTKELTNTPVDQTKKFGEIISDYCEKMKGIYHIKDSDGIPYSKHFENICKFKTFDGKEQNMIPEYRFSALSAMHNLRNTFSEELSTEENKLANCYNYNICDIVDDLFESKVSSTCYFDLSLYIRSRRKN